VPKPDASLSAVVVSGGKQYRVAPGDRILVDRLTAEPGSSVKLGRVLLLQDGGDIKVGAPAVDGLDVEAKVVGHTRGPRIETLRYKSKKRVRVHRGGRADYTALEILAVGGLKVATGSETEEEEEVETKSKSRAKGAPKRRAKPAPAAAELAVEEEPVVKPAAKSASKTEAKAETKRATRASKKKD
jgi:large subunit ribosomal protein L21